MGADAESPLFAIESEYPAARSMSVTLLVAVSRLVSARGIEGALKKKGFEVANASAELDAMSASYELIARRGLAEVPVARVDGPLRVEVDALGEKLAAMLLAPRYVYEISFAAELSELHESGLVAFGTSLAKEGDGALFDPQEDAVLWPASRPKRFVTPRATERGPSLRISLFLPCDRDAGQWMTQYLQSCQRVLPEALPRRFGLLEPLQEKLRGAEDEQKLIELAKQQGALACAGMMLWKCAAPFTHGNVFFADRRRGSMHTSYREDASRDRLRPMTSISLGLSAAVALHSEQWADAVSDLTLHLCRTIQPFYACVTLAASPTSGPDWIGVPETAAWISWYGEPYRDAVAATDKDVQAFANGLFVRRSQLPISAEEAARHPTQPARRYTALYGNVSEPHRIADEVPAGIPRGDR